MVNWIQYEGHADGWDKQLETLGGGFYQSYGWGEVRRVAGWQPVRFLATSRGQVVAAASVLTQRRAGIPVCWIPGGPVGPAVHFGSGLRGVLGKLLGCRIFYCRMSLLRESQQEEKEGLVRTGWKRPSVNMSSGLTMRYSLKEEESERLGLASRNWRHNLKRSGSHGLLIERWNRPHLTEISALYREMEELKTIPVQHSEAELEAMLVSLGNRLVLYRCLDVDGKLLAVRGQDCLVILPGISWLQQARVREKCTRRTPHSGRCLNIVASEVCRTMTLVALTRLATKVCMISSRGLVLG